ncbi:hypothetical protein LINGRAHAP2_LOCUS26824 [Linum grandiflorum]
MASYGEVQESNRKELTRILRGKNLYFGYSFNTKIFGIRIEPSTGEIGSLAEETPDIIENPVYLGKWDIHSGLGLPVGMGMFVMNSKLYMIGGSNIEDIYLGKDGFSSELVYEFPLFPKPNFSESNPSTSVPPLPRAVPNPMIIEHLGEIYVLYGENVFASWEIESSNLENRFLVLRNRDKGCMTWESLPLPKLGRTFLPYPYDMLWLHGGIGSGIYVRGGGALWCYDTKKGQWENKGKRSNHESGALTLSSLSVPTTNAEGHPSSSYVVIFPCTCDTSYIIEAALVDGDGRASRFQVIHKGRSLDDCLGFRKLIELEEPKEEKDANNPHSSTFALAFTPDYDVIGLTVIRVTLLHSAFSQDEEDFDFLKVEVLLNQRYMTNSEFNPEARMMSGAFFG